MLTSSEAFNFSSFLSGLPQFILGVVTTFGVYKYYVEPKQLAGALRRKYGTALWIACKELNVHFARIQETLGDDRVFDSLLKIPANDWKERPDWFTKRGFYTMVTAHKIALVSAWLYIYQQELLFSRTRASSDLLSDLYNHASAVRKAFSHNSCLWPEYFDAVGSQYVERLGETYRPLTFSAFCLRCASDKAFLRFYDQLHNFIHITAKDERDSARKGRFDRIRQALKKLMELLDRKGLLAGLQKDRIGEEISSRNVESSLNAETDE
jgi:hypothetical protein